MKPSAGTFSMLRPACVGTICDVAWARNVRQRSTVRSSSRSMSAIESLISATRMARRCRGDVTPWKARGSGTAGAAATSASGRTSPASRSSAATSSSTRPRPARSSSPSRTRRESSRVICSREVPTRLAISLCVGAGSSRARFSPMPATRARRSSSTQVRRCTGCAPSSSRRPASSRTEPVSRRSRRSRTDGVVGEDRRGMPRATSRPAAIRAAPARRRSARGRRSPNARRTPRPPPARGR